MASQPGRGVDDRVTRQAREAHLFGVGRRKGQVWHVAASQVGTALRQAAPAGWAAEERRGSSGRRRCRDEVDDAPPCVGGGVRELGRLAVKEGVGRTRVGVQLVADAGRRKGPVEGPH
jgi:hypothetical protein